MMNTLLQHAIDAAYRAGAEIMTHYATTEYTTKEDGSPVTIADARSNDILMTCLAETHIPVLSEENETRELPYPERLWIIDPLDGTKDFIAKNGDFCVMIGLLEKGEPTLGVVYAPVENVIYYAEKGSGAWRKDMQGVTALTVHTMPQNPPRFICSVNHFTPVMERVANEMNATKIPRGSIGIKAGVIAENQGEFFFSLGRLGEWDVCAPEIIAREAGIVVTDIHNNPLSYGTADHRIVHGALFAHPTLHADVQKHISASLESSV
jgi:3'(2'), 5'-bisphosphate nucleotidase